MGVHLVRVCAGWFLAAMLLLTARPAQARRGADDPGGKMRVQVEGLRDRYQVTVEIGNRTFSCGEVTSARPCALNGLPQGLGLLRATGTSSFTREIGVSDWPTRVRIEQAGHGPLLGGLLVLGLGVGLVVGTDVGSVGYALGAGLVAGGTSMAVWDLGRNRDLVRVEADGVAIRRAQSMRAVGLVWRFSL